MSEGLKIERVAVDSLEYDSKNARLHSPRNIDAIKDSLQRFGQRKPIVVLRDSKRVVAGNGTLEAAQSLGWKEIDVVFADLTDDEGTAFAVADNRTAELAHWDADKLPQLLAEIKSYDDSELINLIGFNEADLARVIDDDETAGLWHPDMENVLYRVVVEVKDAGDQESLITELEAKGYKCLPLMS